VTRSACAFERQAESMKKRPNHPVSTEPGEVHRCDKFAGTGEKRSTSSSLPPRRSWMNGMQPATAHATFAQP
jgi:hypothetical protein